MLHVFLFLILVVTAVVYLRHRTGRSTMLRHVASVVFCITAVGLFLLATGNDTEREAVTPDTSMAPDWYCLGKGLAETAVRLSAPVRVAVVVGNADVIADTDVSVFEKEMLRGAGMEAHIVAVSPLKEVASVFPTDHAEAFRDIVTDLIEEHDPDILVSMVGFPGVMGDVDPHFLLDLRESGRPIMAAILGSIYDAEALRECIRSDALDMALTASAQSPGRRLLVTDENLDEIP